MEKGIRLIALLTILLFLIVKFLTNYHTLELILGYTTLLLFVALIVLSLKRYYLK